MACGSSATTATLGEWRAEDVALVNEFQQPQ